MENLEVDEALLLLWSSYEYYLNDEAYTRMEESLENALSRMQERLGVESLYDVAKCKGWL